VIRAPAPTVNVCPESCAVMVTVEADADGPAVGGRGDRAGEEAVAWGLVLVGAGEVVAVVLVAAADGARVVTGDKVGAAIPARLPPQLVTAKAQTRIEPPSTPDLPGIPALSLLDLCHGPTEALGQRAAPRGIERASTEGSGAQRYRSK
jgi:hypothetical protein